MLMMPVFIDYLLEKDVAYRWHTDVNDVKSQLD